MKALYEAAVILGIPNNKLYVTSNKVKLINYLLRTTSMPAKYSKENTKTVTRLVNLLPCDTNLAQASVNNERSNLRKLFHEFPGDIRMLVASDIVPLRTVLQWVELDETCLKRLPNIIKLYGASKWHYANFPEFLHKFLEDGRLTEQEAYGKIDAMKRRPKRYTVKFITNQIVKESLARQTSLLTEQVKIDKKTTVAMQDSKNIVLTGTSLASLCRQFIQKALEKGYSSSIKNMEIAMVKQIRALKE